MDVKEFIKNRLPQKYSHTMVDSLGINFLSIEEGKVVAEMEVNEKNCQNFGILSGGATIAMAETMAGLGSVYIVKDDEQPAGIQVSANHFNMAKYGTKVVAEAILINKSRSIHTWRIDIVGDSEKLISSVTVLNFITKRRDI